jgi:hypothetical protein
MSKEGRLERLAHWIGREGHPSNALGGGSPLPQGSSVDSGTFEA